MANTTNFNLKIPSTADDIAIQINVDTPANLVIIDDTLNDLNVNKLDKTKVANNLTETVAGKALDATQGKIINDDLGTHKADYATLSKVGHIQLQTTVDTSETKALTPKALNNHLIESASKHIKESGSNANGSYIKFDDGTMICTHNATVTDQAITDVFGSMFTGTRVWTYPASFISNPVVSAGIFRWGTGASWGSCWSNNLTSATMRVWDAVSRTTGIPTIIAFNAIGRWK